MRGGIKKKQQKERKKGETEERPSEEMNRRNSLSRWRGSTPGLLPYESKVLCDEAESCCLCGSDTLQNLAGAEIINTAPDAPHFLIGLMVPRDYKMCTLVLISINLLSIVSMITQ